ncbi:hypothetical protein DITRI_Ditri05aG0140300 [Diplodiscus trichospermus]
MLLAGDIGFSGLLLVVSLVLPFVGFFIRQKWRLSVARQAEIKRLLIFASEEAARAELEASAGYGTISVSRNDYQCAVCNCPPATRCARCKAVRYCSRKFQVIHWRNGHKEECHPPAIASTTHQNHDEGGDSVQKVVEPEQYVDKYVIKEKLHAKRTGTSSTEPALSNSAMEHHQCAVCYCPTTTQRARCKAGRYCSAKCQIIHWRQGHKEERHRPAIATHQNHDEGRDSGQKVVKQEQYGDRYGIKEKQHANPTATSSTEPALSNSTSSALVLHGKDDNRRLEFHAYGEETNCASESSGASFSGFSSSTAGSESSDDVSVCESISSNEPDKMDASSSADANLDTFWTASGVNSVGLSAEDLVCHSSASSCSLIVMLDLILQKMTSIFP